MIAIVGGGPAGFFGAIAAKEAAPQRRVVILEKAAKVLRKVKISGGGRCNVTHACFDPGQLCGFYPRGHRELIGPFSRFGPAQTIDWFAERGVPMRTFEDGCLFPESDSSQTIIDCLADAARRAGVEIRTRAPVEGITRDDQGFTVTLADGPAMACAKVLIATGGQATPAQKGAPYRPAGGYALAAGLGHAIIRPVPSLFTFTIKDTMLEGLAGIVAPEAQVFVEPGDNSARIAPQTGPLLITHWGLSGPVILKLSAWGARFFHDRGYRFGIAVDWFPETTQGELEAGLKVWAQANPRKQVSSGGPGGLSRRLWERLSAQAGLPVDLRWAGLGRTQRTELARTLKATRLQVVGQSAFKEEFVAAGGVPLKDVDFRTMESRIAPGLHFAGEVLDVDGLTGGFNFQACWTTGWLAGRAMAALPG